MRNQTHQPLRARYCAFGVACITGVLSLLALLPTQTTAQGLLGVILDDEAGVPVASAQVVLADSAGNVVTRALSDNAGRFFVAVDIGTYALVVSRLGYETVHVTDVELTSTDVLSLRILLPPEAVEIPGLVVQGEQRVRYLEGVGFYERKRMGLGHQIEIERSRQIQTVAPSDYIRRIPGVVVQDGEVRSTRRGRGAHEYCLLQLVVDGIYVGVDLNDLLVLWDVEAIEVYNGVSNIPARWQNLARMGYLEPNTDRVLETCGIVAVWTKH